MAKKKVIRGNFKASTAAEKEFYKSLRKVAEVSGHLIDKHIDGTSIKDDQAMMDELTSYAKKLGPWAERQAKKMVDTVQRANKRAYKKKADQMNVAMNKEISEKTFPGQLVRAMQEEHVRLIKSIPLEAGQRAQAIALKAAIEGRRAVPDQSTIDALQKELGLSTEVAINRAKLIAITETAKANAFINQVRAQAVGSTHYRWHNSGDSAVRHSHKFLKGKPIGSYVFSWDHPPTLDDGTKGNPGEFPRCRCFAEPIFDNDIGKKTLYKS